MYQPESREELLGLIREATRLDRAGVFESSVTSKQKYRVLTLNLTTDQSEGSPLEISFPFRSFLVYSATDNGVSVSLRLESRDTLNDVLTLKNQNAIKLPFPVKKAFLHWSAQSGKTMTILFFFEGEFATGQLQSVTSGGINISEGSAISTAAKLTVAAASETLMLAQDVTRIAATIQNQGSTPIFVGATGVDVAGGANPGIRIQPGESLVYRNTAALYGIALTSDNTDIAILVES